MNVTPDRLARVSSSTKRAEALHLSGERTAPGIAEENYWFRRHEAAYLALRPHCADATVLEAGCGEGYGADLLARHAAQVLALDYDRDAVEHVAVTYSRVTPSQANLAFLPLGSSTVDVIVNFQVIEHLWNQEGFLAECRRVLCSGGKLVLTTPNRLTFTPGSDTPLNPYHTREFAPSELDALVRDAGFEMDTLHGLHHGPALRALDAYYGGSIIEAQLDVVMGALPGQAHWPPELLADIASVRADDFHITGEHLESSLDLVAVAKVS